MHVLYLMRYSFYGQSGWRGEESRDPEKLFSPERLEQREYYLRKVALPSLRDQTNQDFNLIVLSSTLLPNPYKDRLKDVCNDILGPRAHVIFREPDSTSKVFQKYRWQTFDRYAHTAQIVLDDDDEEKEDDYDGNDGEDDEADDTKRFSSLAGCSQRALDLHHNFFDPSKVKGTEIEKHDAFLKARNEIKEYFKYFVIENLI